MRQSLEIRMTEGNREQYSAILRTDILRRKMVLQLWF